MTKWINNWKNKNSICTPDGNKRSQPTRKKKKRTIFISLSQTCYKVWQSQFKPKEEVWQRMVGNYKDQKARRGQIHSNNTDNLCACSKQPLCAQVDQDLQSYRSMMKWATTNCKPCSRPIARPRTRLRTGGVESRFPLHKKITQTFIYIWINLIKDLTCRI